tara:strand:- start:140 stop:544 length:405 start_codon:yes stop_codon:yes gene_type:complete
LRFEELNMNSDRVEEIAALRAQKKLDRIAEEKANLAKAEAEAKAHEASMARIAKKMARIAAQQSNDLEPAIEAIVEQPVAAKPKPVAKKKVLAKKKPVAAKPKPVAKKKVAAKKVAAKTKPKPRGRPKGSKKTK